MLQKNRPSGLLTLCALSDYIPVMSDDELVLLLNGCLPIDQSLIDKWEEILLNRKNYSDELFRDAYAKQR